MIKEKKHSEDLPVNIEKHPKQDFQVERLAFFSDAIFAIAITLMVIELKVPIVTDNTTVQDVWNQLFDLKYHLLAILLSFLLIATYWRHHHFLFKYIHNYNNPILSANMLVLLPIIFFPFTTAFWAESTASSQINPEIYVLGLRFWALNHVLALLAIYILYWLAIVKYKEMSYKIPAKEKFGFISIVWFKIIIFAAIFVITFFTNNAAVFAIGILIAVLLFRIFQRIFKKINGKLK